MMKKLRFLIVFLFLIYGSLNGQIGGDGSIGNPYTGELTTGSFPVSGNKYFDAIIVSGGTLTISAGSTMFASNMAAFIVVSGFGALIADGSEGSLITFTADHDGDGISGATETWRNILFDEFSSGTSLIDYAIIEKGTGDDYFYGGGIDIWGGNVTISNSTIRNCNNEYANGGGIAVTPSGSPVSLTNLKIYNNIAAGVGGGIFTDGNVTISNCEVYNNTASNGAGIYLNGAGSVSNSIIRDNSGGEGIYSFGADAGGSIANCIIYNNGTGIYLYGERDIVNSTIVNNSSGITSASGSSPKVVNTVLWGNTSQYNLESGASLELANCGIQGGFTVGTDGGGNKNLSSTNGADTGPNFVSAANNFHLNSWITPLVDGGAISYSGVTIPGTDTEGKSRIRTIDIGAYEFIYYVWTGSASTDWATPANWVGSPSSIPISIVDNKVLIPKGCANYPTVASLSLSTRGNVTVEPQAGLKVTGATTVGSGCTFLLESDATGSANFITGPTLSGSFTVEMFLAGGGDPNFKWHYITTPVQSISKTVVTTSIGNPNNLLNYNEAIVTTDKLAGWNWHDGYSGSSSFTTLLNTFGYNVYVPTDQTAIFTGPLKTGSNFVNFNITYTSGINVEVSGWNLIGNPFTSTVDINQFTFGSKLDLDWTVYFTRDNQFCSWSKTGNAGINGATRYMPPLQGFFVHAKATGTGRTLLIPATSRVYSTTNSLYKKGASSETEIKETRTNPYLKFNVSDGVSLTDESIIYFFDDATNGFDSEYDAYKLMSNNPAHPQIYSINTENTELGLNALPVPTGITTVPLKLRIGVEKNYTINVLDLQNLDACKVTLIHGTNRIDLKANPTYTFSASSGTISNMSVEFDNLITSDIIPVADKETSCWYSNNTLFIKSNLAGFETGSDLSIYDLNGSIVFSKNKLSIIKDGISEFPLNLPAGLYIVALNNNNLRVNRKVVIAD
jgi:hypothetical protein